MTQSDAHILMSHPDHHLARASQPDLSGVSWEIDATVQLRRSERRAWLVAGAACLAACACALALVALVPLHRVVPFVVTVDKLTGETAVTTTEDASARPNAMADKHWIKTFVIARERYNWQVVEQDYNTVRRLAGSDPWATYQKAFEGDDGLDHKYGQNIEVTPNILSITLAGSGLATVRFELVRRDRRLPADTGTVTSRRIATLRYAYERKTLRESEAVENPFGFVVQGYQTDPELVAEGAAR